MENIKSYLEQAPGPMPWYWQTLPEISSHIWRFQEESSVKLFEESPDRKCKLIVNIYTRIIVMPPSHIALWSEANDSIELAVLDIQRLTVLDALQESNSSKWPPFICNGEPVAKLRIDKKLPEGSHKLEVPQILKSIPEIFLIASTYSEAASYTVYAVNTAENSVQVLPQKWFAPEKFDIGYEWITKVTRHPETGRIIGTGFRINDFILSEDGCHLDSWA